MTSWEAEQARNFLEAQGIKAFVEGVNTQLALSYAGGAMSGVKLLVAEDDAKLAEQLLLEEGPDPEAEAWTCRRCYSEVDAGFDVCWKCGSDRKQESESTASDASNALESERDAGEKGPPDEKAIHRIQRGSSVLESRGNAAARWLSSYWILIFAMIELLALIALVLMQSRQ
ncbi:MAG: DUF2007 domain-containing protein [bacterium]|nr:DUF2007 domain-containing protein [bacterium]